MYFNLVYKVFSLPHCFISYHAPYISYTIFYNLAEFFLIIISLEEGVRKQYSITPMRVNVASAQIYLHVGSAKRILSARTDSHTSWREQLLSLTID